MTSPSGGEPRALLPLSSEGGATELTLPWNWMEIVLENVPLMKPDSIFGPALVAELKHNHSVRLHLLFNTSDGLDPSINGQLKCMKTRQSD